jgi:hypothetical protein
MCTVHNRTTRNPGPGLALTRTWTRTCPEIWALDSLAVFEGFIVYKSTPWIIPPLWNCPFLCATLEAEYITFVAVAASSDASQATLDAATVCVAELASLDAGLGQQHKLFMHLHVLLKGNYDRARFTVRIQWCVNFPHTRVWSGSHIIFPPESRIRMMLFFNTVWNERRFPFYDRKIFMKRVTKNAKTSCCI